MTEFKVTAKELEALEQRVPCLEVFIEALKQSPEIDFQIVDEDEIDTP